MKSKRSSDETSAKSKKHSGWTNVASIGGVNVNTVVTEDIGNSIDSEKSNSPCRLRFQQSPVEVMEYACIYLFHHHYEIMLGSECIENETERFLSVWSN